MGKALSSTSKNNSKRSKKNSKLTFLVTGGSGFLGANTCKYLLEKKAIVRALDLLPFEDEELQKKVPIFVGDIRDRELVSKALVDVDVVIHAAAALPLWKPDEIRSVNKDGTEILLDESLKKKIKRFVFVSSTAVYGIPDHHPLFENDRLQGVGPYGESKIEAERICESFRKKMCVPILRPKSFIGPGRLGVFDVLFDWLRRGKSIPIIGSGKNLYQLLHVDDLNQAIWLASNQPSSIANDTFNIGAEKYGTMMDDYSALVKFAGFGKKVVPTPARAVIIVLKSLHQLGLSPLYQWIYETADKDSFVSIDKAKQKLGFRPQKSNQDALIETYQWYLKNYEKYLNKSGITHRVPWKQGLLRFVSYFF